MTMEPITTHAWEKRELQEALARFAKHQIVSSSPGRWQVRAPGTRNLAYEVTVQSGRVLVDGDIDPIGFAGGSGWDSPEEYVAWIGRHDSDVEYAAGKVLLNANVDAGSRAGVRQAARDFLASFYDTVSKSKLEIERFRRGPAVVRTSRWGRRED